MSEQQLLRNPAIELTNEVISEALGSANAAYVRFIEGLTNHNIQVEWRYYNDGKVWLGKGLYKWTGVKGGQKEVTAFWLSVWDGFFKVTIYVPAKARADAMNLPLDDRVKSMIAESNQMGKLKFFPVTFSLDSDELFDDVYTLVDFRKTIK